MATIFDFLKCEECGKEFQSMTEPSRKTKIDKEGFTHTYCTGCYEKQNGGL